MNCDNEANPKGMASKLNEEDENSNAKHLWRRLDFGFLRNGAHVEFDFNTISFHFIQEYSTHFFFPFFFTQTIGIKHI